MIYISKILKIYTYSWPNKYIIKLTSNQHIRYTLGIHKKINIKYYKNIQIIFPKQKITPKYNTFINSRYSVEPR